MVKLINKCIKPLSKRKGWEKAFKEMHANGDDKLIIPDIFEEENLEEWEPYNP